MRSAPLLFACRPSCNFAHELTTALKAGNRFRRTGVGTYRPYAQRIHMLTSEARALVTEIQDRLIELYVQQDEAGEQDPDRVRELQVEIDKAAAQREEIRR